MKAFARPTFTVACTEQKYTRNINHALIFLGISLNIYLNWNSEEGKRSCESLESKQIRWGWSLTSCEAVCLWDVQDCVLVCLNSLCGENLLSENGGHWKQLVGVVVSMCLCVWSCFLCFQDPAGKCDCACAEAPFLVENKLNSWFIVTWSFVFDSHVQVPWMFT